MKHTRFSPKCKWFLTFCDKVERRTQRDCTTFSQAYVRRLPAALATLGCRDSVVTTFAIIAYLSYGEMRMLPGLLITFSFYLLCCAPDALATSDARRLYDDIMTDYNKLIRPVGNNSDKLTVKLGLRLSQLIDVVSVPHLPVIIPCASESLYFGKKSYS